MYIYIVHVVHVAKDKLHLVVIIHCIFVYIISIRIHLVDIAIDMMSTYDLFIIHLFVYTQN